MSSNGMVRRLDRLEDLTLQRAVERLARRTGLAPDALLRRAEEIAELRRQLGSAGALQALAARQGESVDDFQARVEQIDAYMRGDRDELPGAPFEPA